MSEYQSFYERAYRDGCYSAEGTAEGHYVSPMLKKVIERYGLKDKKVLEIGSGNGKFQNVVDDYTGIDVSESAKKFYTKAYVVIRNGKDYPFSDETFDFIFTHATFEHIPDVNHALKEMMRVTKRGGILFFNPAWQCRSWAAKGYGVRPCCGLNFFGKIYKATIPIQDHVLFRSLSVVPKRIFFALTFLTNKQRFQQKLVYRKIKPNYEVFWQTDSDACNSIDPFLAILYFRANGFIVVNYPSLLRQFFVRTGALVLQKA